MVGFVVGAGLIAGAAASIGGALLTDTGAGGRAAEAQAAESRQAEKRARKTLSPFIEAGTGALPGLQEGSTVGGLDARLGRIFDSDIFGELVGERTRSVQGQLAAGGLTRSGTAVQEISRVPGDLGLQIEQLLTSRLGGLAGQGLQAGGALSGIQLQGGQFRGQALSSGIVTDAEASNARNQALLNSIASSISGLGAFAGGGGGASGIAAQQAQQQIGGFNF